MNVEVRRKKLRENVRGSLDAIIVALLLILIVAILMYTSIAGLIGKTQDALESQGKSIERFNSGIEEVSE